jgi:hypothetical protein
VDRNEITPKTKNEVMEVLARIGSGRASSEVARQVANVFSQADAGTLTAGHVHQAGFFDDVFGTVKKAAKAAVNLATSPEGQQVIKTIGKVIGTVGPMVAAMSVEGPAPHGSSGVSNNLSMLNAHLQQMVAQQEITSQDASKMYTAVSRIASGQTNKEVAKQAMNMISMAQSGALSPGHVHQAGFFDDVFGTVKSIASSAVKIATSPEGQKVLQTAGQIIGTAAPLVLGAL